MRRLRLRWVSAYRTVREQDVTCARPYCGLSVRFDKAKVVRRIIWPVSIETSGTVRERCTGLSGLPKMEMVMHSSKSVPDTTAVWVQEENRLTPLTAFAGLFRAET